MNVERLQHLITILERVRDNKWPFDMEVWFDSNYLPNTSHIHPCNTAACALGHACMDPEFQKEGLRIVQRTGYDGAADPGFGYWRGLDAAEQFFELSHRTACEIFLPVEYRSGPETWVPPLVITPNMVIARIKLLVDAYLFAEEVASERARELGEQDDAR